MDSRPHGGEHSAENQIPFVQTALPDARLVVALLGDHEPVTIRQLSDGLAALARRQRIVVIASTCAQVNFWTRLIQSLGVQPAGFSSECSILDLEKYRTLKGA